MTERLGKKPYEQFNAIIFLDLRQGQNPLHKPADEYFGKVIN